MSFNPYHQWLGLDPKIRNPHYFQLLGVSSQVRDSAEFPTQVVAAVQVRLDKLKQVNAGDQAPLLEQLKKKIVLAGDVLADDRRRTQYVLKLKTELEAAKKNRTDTTATRQAKNSGSPPVPPTIKPIPQAIRPSPPQSDGVSAKDLHPPKSATPISHDSAIPIIAKPVIEQPAMTQPVPTIPAAIAVPVPASDPNSIPMAVPIGNLGGQSTRPTQNSDAQIPPSQFSESTEAFSQTSDTFDAGPRVRPAIKRRKKRSGLLAGFFLLALAGITIAGFYLFLNRLLPPKAETAISTSKPVPTSDFPDADGNLKPVYPTLNEDSSEVATADSDPGIKTNPPKMVPSTSEMVPSKNDPFNMPTDEMPGTIDETIENTDFSEIPDSIDAFDTSSPSPEIVTPEPVKSKKLLSEMQVLEIRWRLQQIRQSMLRRDPESIVLQLRRTKSIFDEVLADEKFELSAEQQRLLDHFNASQQALIYIDGFWALVIKNCQQLVGGTEIEVGQQILGFVEANNEFVTLRNAGSNINYQYQYIPPGLAVAMAELGTIPDIPTWRLQKAALYSLYANQDNEMADQVNEFLSQSEADGHDVALMREFLDDDFSEIVPNEKIDFPSKARAAGLLSELSVEYKIGDVDRLKMGDARQRLKSVLFEARPADPEQAIALLDYARRLAIRGATVYSLEDAILELGNRTNLDLSNLYLESFSEISQQKLEPIEARKLMETAIPFLKSKWATELDPKDIFQLAKRLAIVAQKFEFADSLRRLDQLK